MPIANLNDIISDFPRLSQHAVNGEDVAADLAGLVGRLTRSTGSVAPAEWQTTMKMIRGRLLAQLQALDGWDADLTYRLIDPTTLAEREFYERAIAHLDAALVTEQQTCMGE